MQENSKDAIFETVLGILLSTIGSIIFGSTAYSIPAFNWIFGTVITVVGGIILIINGMRKYSDYREHKTLTERLGVIDSPNF